MRCCNRLDSKLALTTENTQVYFNMVFGGYVTAVPCAVPSLVQDLCVTMVIPNSLNDTCTHINIILICSIDKLIDILQYIMILSLLSLVTIVCIV